MLHHLRVKLSLCDAFPCLKRLNSSLANSNVRVKFDRYCMDFVKTHDPEHYQLGLLLPYQIRGCYFMLRSLNAELATIKDNTRGNLAACRLRFQWWQNILDDIYDDEVTSLIKGDNDSVIQRMNKSEPILNHPLASALDFYVQNYKLSAGWFYRSLESRYMIVTIRRLFLTVISSSGETIALTPNMILCLTLKLRWRWYTLLCFTFNWSQRPPVLTRRPTTLPVTLVFAVVLLVYCVQYLMLTQTNTALYLQISC